MPQWNPEWILIRHLIEIRGVAVLAISDQQSFGTSLPLNNRMVASESGPIKEGTSVMAMVTITGEQRKVLDEAARLKLISSDREAFETGLFTLREQVKARVSADRAKQEAEEQAERERIAANQFSLFGETTEV